MEKSSTGAGAGAGAATGCYKCGRPGHWSRDCPLSATTNPNPNPTSSSNPNSSSNTNFSRPSFKSGGTGSGSGGGGGGGSSIKPPFEKTEKPKKVPRRIPKLTSELLLSNDGLGYILRHFPRSFKYRGRGHEVKDLENLIGLYSQWHSHLLPYYPFEQFIHKVEQVGASKRVKTCIKDLRERVANGGDPSKLHEPPVEHDVPPYEPEETNNVEQPSWDMGDLPSEHHDTDAMQEDTQEVMQEEMPDEIYQNATTEPCESSQRQVNSTAPVLPGNSSVNESSNPVPDYGESGSSKMEVTDDQKARMEASRLKALERAAARARLAKAD